MDEVIPSLWIGDLPSALDAEKLREKNICSIVSAMRGRVILHDVSQSMLIATSFRDTMILCQAFNKHQINIDDTDEEDVLVHFLPAISFIQAELDNGRGVLVHCQAGMSASLSQDLSVFAYFIYLCRKAVVQRSSLHISCIHGRLTPMLHWSLSKMRGLVFSE